MKIGTTVTLAVSALMRAKMRSLLTTLGVVIGVAAVIIMQSMGAGATALVTGELSGLGSNMLMLVPGAQRGNMGPPGAGAAQFKTRRCRGDAGTAKRSAWRLAPVSPEQRLRAGARLAESANHCHWHRQRLPGRRGAGVPRDPTVVPGDRASVPSGPDDLRQAAVPCASLAQTVRDRASSGLRGSALGAVDSGARQDLPVR